VSVRHRKQVPANRPDDGDATIVHGIAAWGAPHVSPDFLAYMATVSSAQYQVMPGPNRPDTEIPNFRSKYDFTYVDQVRLVFGTDWGSAKVSFKYSSDQVSWYSFDGFGGPYVTQVQGEGVETSYASPWVNLVAGAKGDRYIAPFYRENTDLTILRPIAFFLYVR
jgi:hypothetical protein